jgi:DNA-binding response OmpR family regulator
MTKTLKARPSICILDDDEVILRLLQTQLKQRHFSCRGFSRTEEFIRFLNLQEERADLYIVDYFLEPHSISGLDVCRKIKGRHRAPVIMLTSNKATVAMVNCLQAGADQYIVKPHHIDELEARIYATMRLYENSSWKLDATASAERLQGQVTVNWLLRMLTTVDGKFVRLTEKEMALFELLVAVDGVLSRESAYSSIYGSTMAPLNRSIDVLVSRLRRKLVVLSIGMDVLSVRGGGYMLINPEKGSGPTHEV